MSWTDTDILHVQSTYCNGLATTALAFEWKIHKHQIKSATRFDKRPCSLFFLRILVAKYFQTGQCPKERDVIVPMVESLVSRTGTFEYIS